ncbi:patatin-like phospholipase family protein [Acinetobacter haemolyticus]|nr:patatin-like phospholipase family protein [Acinetobacter haemolyticus]NAR47197.1 patatin-like phospholipase family protein [Acinetobacter haemolyticus]NAR63332.1 patatin-like phospholipase family protein [Acinetobacter haemolyticus]NAR72085.1 patatin-like phospholipase family protein [Acinetobacter haemolyticus]NAR78195.1 patatin-like phospholipase family protein [Acinetobacter haemolyticus]
MTLVGCQTTAHISPVVEDAQTRVEEQPFAKIKQQKRPVVALVLGSGGARGYAHIGVIEVLEQHGIRPDLIVGTSAGSIVGSIYASGKSAAELREIALKLKANDVRDVSVSLKGFFDGKKVEDYVNEQVQNTPLQRLKIPMYVVATELKEGTKTVFNYGNTGQAVRASASIPSMFVPIKIGHNEYVDGGLVSPVPVQVARDLGADIVIAVDILAQPVHTETTNVWGLFNQNINIMQGRLAEEELKYADIVIQPDLREKVHIFDVKGREITMQAGVDAAQSKLADIQLAIQTKRYSKERVNALLP